MGWLQVLLWLSPQAVVNSCLRPAMTFTKTSQKFGQWTDPKSNAVYGIGFNTEADLDKVKEGTNFELLI